MVTYNMSNPTFKYSQRICAVVLGGLLLSGVAAFAQKKSALDDSFSPSVKKTDYSSSVSSAAKELTEKQKMARQYRAEGIILQKRGDLANAMALFEKSAQLDPVYAVAFNDLGVILEAQGRVQEAKDCYLHAVQLDPKYLSAYTNLALICENERELVQAAAYWRKRAELGLPGDPWTKKAQSRFEDIELILRDERPQGEVIESQVISLEQSVDDHKTLVKKDDAARAQDEFRKAKILLEEGDTLNAYTLAMKVKQLDPACPGIDEFIAKAQTRILAR